MKVSCRLAFYHLVTHSSRLRMVQEPVNVCRVPPAPLPSAKHPLWGRRQQRTRGSGPGPRGGGKAGGCIKDAADAGTFPEAVI